LLLTRIGFQGDVVSHPVHDAPGDVDDLISELLGEVVRDYLRPASGTTDQRKLFGGIDFVSQFGQKAFQVVLTAFIIEHYGNRAFDDTCLPPFVGRTDIDYLDTGVYESIVYGPVGELSIKRDRQ